MCTIYTQVFWKLDFVENSLRMRRLLKRNYSGTTHKGATANYEDIQPMGRLNIEENKDSGKEAESSLGNSLPANASLLLPEESLLEEGHEDEGTRSDFEITEDRKDDLEHDFVSSEDISEPSGESTLDSVKSSNIKEIANNAIALAGSTVVGADERMLLEIPAMMVQPLRLMKGRFQVSVFPMKFSVKNLLINCLHAHLVDSLFCLHCLLIWQSISVIIYFFGSSAKDLSVVFRLDFFVYVLANLTSFLFLCLEFWLKT